MWRQIAAATLGAVLLAGTTGCSSPDSDNDELSYDEWVEQQLEEDREFEERQERRVDRQARRQQRDDRIIEELSDAAMAADLRAEQFPTEHNLRRAELARSRSWIWNRHRYLSNGYDCPPDAPVKGNWSDNGDGTVDDIYHLPGWVYYGATVPEECFEAATAADEAGYRPSRIRR